VKVVAAFNTKFALWKCWTFVCASEPSGLYWGTASVTTSRNAAPGNAVWAYLPAPQQDAVGSAFFVGKGPICTVS